MDRPGIIPKTDALYAELYAPRGPRREPGFTLAEKANLIGFALNRTPHRCLAGSVRVLREVGVRARADAPTALTAAQREALRAHLIATYAFPEAAFCVEALTGLRSDLDRVFDGRVRENAVPETPFRVFSPSKMCYAD